MRRSDSVDTSAGLGGACGWVTFVRLTGRGFGLALAFGSAGGDGVRGRCWGRMASSSSDDIEITSSSVGGGRDRAFLEEALRERSLARSATPWE